MAENDEIITEFEFVNAIAFYYYYIEKCDIVVLETGMGGLLVDAIQRQDNPLVQALVLIYSSIGIIGLFLGDILMASLDPRIKLDRKGGAR